MMSKVSNVLHKIRLICYFFFPILLTVFFAFGHTDADIRTLLADGVIPSNIGSTFAKYAAGVNQFLLEWGLRDFNVLGFIYWVVPVASLYVLTLPILFLLDFIERDIFKSDKVLSEFFGLLPYILLFLTVRQESFDGNLLTSSSFIFRFFGSYVITGNGLSRISGFLVSALGGNIFTYVLTVHYIGVEVFLLPVYAVLYLIKLLKGGKKIDI